MQDIISLLSSAAGGGLLGIIGVAFKGFQQIKENNAQRAHELEMRKQDSAEMQQEAALALRQTEAEIAGKAALANIEAQVERDAAQAATQQASYENDKATYSHGALAGLRGWLKGFVCSLLVLVDVFRGIMRPSITCYLLIVETLIVYKLYQLIAPLEGVTASAAWSLFEQVILSVVFLTATAVTWWFGSRPTQQHKL